MMTLNDFARACETLAERGFTVEEATYYDKAFGSWSIKFSSKHLPLHLLTWDGRDRWLILRAEVPESERPVRFPVEELDQMSWEDRLTAESQRDWDAWQDRWIGREESEQTLDRVLEEVGA